MKSVIINMSEMSESTEIYESRPNRFLVYFIYLVLGMFFIAFIWMYFWKIDIVVTSNAVFRGEEKVYDISSDISGKIQTCNIADGQFVKEGEVLLTIDSESFAETIKNYQDRLTDIEQRIQMLTIYLEYLEGETEQIDSFTENKYYEEFNNRKQLLEADIELSGKNTEELRNQYQKETENIRKSIDNCKNKIHKLEQAEESIISRINPFDISDNYYYSIVNSYLSNYEAVEFQYDNQIKELKNSIIELEKQKNTTDGNNMEAVEALQGNIDAIQEEITLKEKEQEKVLINLELQEISNLQQQIETFNTTLRSLEAELSSVEYKMAGLNDSDTEITKDISVMKEKNNIAVELLTYEEKKSECEVYLKSYNQKKVNCSIVANTTGYVSLNTEVRQGGYIQEGTVICRILPEENHGYYAEIYVENRDIGRLKEGQNVKFEIAAYPSGEYGYFTGVIDNIAKDITVDNSGSSFYLVKAKCDKITVMNEKEEEGTIMNGMVCQAKIIVEKKSVLNYLLEKIKLFD